MKSISNYWEVLYVFPVLLLICIILALNGDGAAGAFLLPAIVGTTVWAGVFYTKRKERRKKNG